MNRSKAVSTSRNQKNSTKIKRRNIKETSIPLKSVYVDVSNSNISSFRFLSRLQKVLSVNATNTMISDFSGAPLCSTLRNIKIQGSPISKNPNYRLMILIMLCPDIEYIDNQKVTKSEKDKSLSLQLIVQPNLYNGFIITSSDPVTLTRADETFVINPDDIKETKGKNHNEIKFDQTIEMMEKLSFEISNASDELGVTHIPKLPIRELLKRNKIDATDYLATNSKTAFINAKKGKQSSFAKAFKEYTNTPEDLVESSILFDSPEKREERHSMIMQDSPSKYEDKQTDQNRYNSQILGQQVESDSQTERQDYLNEEEENPDQISIEQLYEDIVEPSIPNKADVTVEKIFGIASEIMASPEKPSRYFEDNDSASSDLSTSLLQKTKQGNENSRIPIKLDSPSKKYGEGLAASRLTQTKFGGYRKISDTESISSEYDAVLNEEEEEIQLTTTEDEAKIDISEFEEEEEELQSNYFTSEKTGEEEEQAPPSKDMPDPDWVISEETEKKSDIEQNQPVADKATGNQNEISQEEEEEPAPPSKDMPDPDWVIQEGEENKELSNQEQIQAPETTEQQQPKEEKTNENQDQINQEEEEPAPPSKDMPDPDWVIQEGEENKELSNQEQIQAPETTERQQPTAADENNANQVELPQEEEPAPPSKDMPDPDWVVQEGEDVEIKSTPEAEQQQKPAADEINDNQNELKTEEEPAPPSKDMPDPDWVVQEGEENKPADQEQIQTPETTENQQQQQPAPSDENKGNQFEVVQEEEEEINDNKLETPQEEEPAPPSKDMPDPDWVIQEGEENKELSNQEQIQAPETTERQQPVADENNENQVELPQEEEPAPPSKDMPDPDWVVQEGEENKESTEPEQIQTPETTENQQQQPTAADENNENQEVKNKSIKNGEEPAPPSKDMPDPDWVIQEGEENAESNEQEQIQAPEQQQPPVEGELIGNQQENVELPQEEEPAPPSKDMPDPDWVVQEGEENKPADQEQIQTPETTENQQQQPNAEDGNNENQVELPQEEEPAPPSKDMPDPDWVIQEGEENKESNGQEQIQTSETTEQQQPAADEANDIQAVEQDSFTASNVENKNIENGEEPAPPSKDMPDPDWVVQEGEENKPADQEQIQTPETTENQQPVADENNENQVELPQETEPAPPSKDMPDPDWVVQDGEDAVNTPTTERSLQVENKEEASSVTEGDNYDPEVIAMLDKQVQPRETVQIEGIPAQEENQQQEEPTVDPSWIINEDEIANQEQQNQSNDKNPFEVSQEGDQTEPKPESEVSQADSAVPSEETSQTEPKPENEANQVESKPEEEVNKAETENKEEAGQAEPPNEVSHEDPSVDPDWIINDDSNQQQNQIEDKNPFEVSQEGAQSESAPKEEPSQEEPSLDPSWVIKSEEEQNEQPPWAS